MRKINILLALAISFICLNCYDNKGNDNYTEMSRITVSGINESYTQTTYVDTLLISPTVTSTNSGDELEYLWILYDSGTGVGTAKTASEADTLSYQKDLIYPVENRQNSYIIQLNIKNKTTGEEVYHTTTLNVITPYSLGFYFLKETSSGNTDLDLIYSDNSIENNIYETKHGASISGSPTKLGVLYEYGFVDPETNNKEKAMCIVPMTENDLRIIRIEDFALIYDYNSMFFSEESPINEKPLDFINYDYDGSGIVFMTDKNIYTQLRTIKFGFPSTIENDYKMGNGYAYDFWGSAVYFFDELNGRFLNIDYYNEISEFEYDNDYPSNNINDKLIYFGLKGISTYAYTFAIFENSEYPDTTDNKYSYYDMFTDFMYNPLNPIQDIKEIEVNLHLDNVSMFANSFDNKLYYLSNNKIYFYDIEEEKEELVKANEITEDDEITYIGYRYWSGTDSFKYFIIATYKDGIYNVYMYELRSGQPTNLMKHITGEGKIKDVHFVSPNLNTRNYKY